MLYMIGLGLGNAKDITVNALEAIKKCNNIYLEHYTSIIGSSKEELEEFYGKEIIIADRDMVEKNAEDTILKNAKKSNAAFLVVGDIFGATTHTDLALRAKKENIKVKYFFNTSIMNAIGVTGLELYKFGKTPSMVFFQENWKPTSAYDVAKENKKQGLHTLILLDIKVSEPSPEDILKNKSNKEAGKPPRFMTVNECLKQLLEIENNKKKEAQEGNQEFKETFTNQTMAIGCARIGHDDFIVKYDTFENLIKFDFGKPLHCAIIPGELHFMEEDFLKSYK